MPLDKLIAVGLPIALGVVMFGAGAANLIGPRSIRKSSSAPRRRARTYPRIWCWPDPTSCAEIISSRRPPRSVANLRNDSVPCVIATPSPSPARALGR
jgi:hypothetical protein